MEKMQPKRRIEIVGGFGEVLEDCECSGNLMRSLNEQSCVIVVAFNALLPMG